LASRNCKIKNGVLYLHTILVQKTTFSTGRLKYYKNKEEILESLFLGGWEADYLLAGEL
jgi:hypothetical protein